MAATDVKLKSLRLSRLEIKRLTWALTLSVAAHFLVWGGYELGQKTGLWRRLHWPEHKPPLTQKINPPQQDIDPSIFLDVEQATPEPPKSAKYYSSKNSQAAQTDPATRTASQPKLNGKQADVPQTRDVPRTQPLKSQPMTEAQRNQAKLDALNALMQAGEVKLAKLDPTPDKNDSPPKPRTLNQARAAQPAVPPPSMAMQQAGGTRAALVPSLDAKSLPFGDYDKKIVEAVQQRWYDLLDSQKFAQNRSGKVTLSFHLNYNGTVSDMQVLQNTVGELLSYVCQQAVTEPAPFAAWPPEMRRTIGENYREWTFTFYYY